MQIKRFIQLGFLLYSFYQVLGQNEYMKSVFTFNDGLPSDVVLSTLVTPSGDFYMTTQKGLFLYDGYRFIEHTSVDQFVSGLFVKNDTLYFHDSKTGLCRTPSFFSKPKILLKNNYTDSDPNNDYFDNIFVDSKGKIWGTDFNYVKYLHPKKKKFKSFLITPEAKSIDSNVEILEPFKNQIWIASKSGLWIYDENSDELKLHSKSKSENWHCNAMIQLENKDILIALTDGRIAEINSKNGQIRYLSNLKENEVVTNFKFYKGTILLSTAKKIYLLKDNRTYLELFDSENALINQFSVDSVTGIFWISTNKGLIKLTPINQGIKIINIPELNTMDNPVISIEEDNYHQLWVLTQSGEVWVYANSNWKKVYTEQKDIQCYTLNIARNQIFLSTNKGVFQWKNDHFKKLNLEGLEIKSAISKVIITPQNELWIIFSNQIIKRYRCETLQEITVGFANNANFWKNNQWNDATVDKAGGIWLIGWMPKGFGITKYNPKNQMFIDISEPMFRNQDADFVGDYYNRIGFSQNNELLFSAYGGWNRVSTNGKVLQLVSIDNYPIATNYITGISEDKNHNVFFATSEGLHIYLDKIDKVAQITQLDGLPSNYLVYAYKQLSDGHIAIGVSNGILLIDTDKILQSQLNNRLKLTQISVNGKLKNTNSNHLELSPQERDITLYFSDLSFLNPQKVNYRYRFEGDEHWYQLEHKSELSLNYIQPGKHHIIVEASDNLYNTQKKKLEIFIMAHPPFTKSNTFYGLVVFLILMLVYGINRYLLSRQRKEKSYLNQIREAEMLTLRTQMNPHFMFNTLNSINSYIIQNKPEDASNYLTTFSKLMRNILQNSKHTYITLENEIKTLKWYLKLEAARLEQSFDYKIKIDEEVDETNQNIPPLIIQPFVENAIWHGLRNKQEKGEISIYIQAINEDFLKITIQDNGIGRELSAKLKTEQTNHKSYGIDITLERLQALHPENQITIEDLYDKKGKPIGTKVILTIKTHK